MKPSPVQLLQLTFRKVSVEVDERHMPEEPPNPLLSVFSFSGVVLQTTVGFGDAESMDKDGAVFQLTLDLLVDNEQAADEPDQRFSPYLLDLRASALVKVQPGAEKLAPPRDLAIVNGAALMWSALREQVATVTSRMPLGQVLLPTVHFHDLKSEASSTEKPTLKPPARKKLPGKPNKS